MRSRAFLFFVCLALSTACDSGEERPPFSQFAGEDTLARAVGGRVFAGADVVEGIVVRLDPRPGYAADAVLAAAPDPAWTAATDGSGIFRFRTGPLRYDLSLRLDHELMVYEDLAFRYVEPALATTQPARGFRARINPVTDPPPKPGNAVAFFVSGPEARALTGDAASLDVVFREFTTVITIHAVEYVAKEGLVAAVAEGRNEVRVHSGAALPTLIAMQPLAPRSSEIVFYAPPPEGFTLAPLDIAVDYLVPTSQHEAATLAPGSTFRFTPIAGARYLARARATRPDGAISESGWVPFDPGAPSVAVSLPEPATPAPRGPADVGSTFSATGGGVYEHVLTPSSGSGTVVRVVTAGDATLPDAARLGMERPMGSYTWKVTRWPELARPDELGGPFVRMNNASATTAGVAVELR